MAAGNTVQLVFAGDSKSLEKTFDKVGNAAKDMAGDFDKSEGKAKSFGKAIDRAAEATDHSEGKFMGAADLLDGLAGAFGLPTEGATNMMRSFGDLSGGFAKIGPMIGGMGSSLGALATGPVGLIIAGVAALAAGIILLYKHSETFRDIVTAAFEAVKKVVGPVMDGIGKAVGFVTGLFGKHKEEVKDNGDAYKAMADNLHAALEKQRTDWQSWHDKITGLIDDMMNPLQRARDNAKISFDEINANLVDNRKFFDEWMNNLTALTNRGFGTLAQKLYELGPTAAAAVADATKRTDPQLRTMTARFDLAGRESVTAFNKPFLVNESLRAMGDTGVVWGTTFKKGFDYGVNGPITIPMNRLGPSVPHLAEGGIVTSPTLALIGESGPEAVVPLGSGGAAGGGPTVIQLVLDGRIVTEVVHNGLLQKQRRTPLGIAS